MELRQPKRKRVGGHIKPQQPFPIVIESESGISVESESWPLYIGNFTGSYVVVCNPEEMTSLYSMGFFGKGSLSRGYPNFGLSKKGIPPIIKERQWQRRKSWMESMKKNITQSLQSQETAESTISNPMNKTDLIQNSDTNDVADMVDDEMKVDKNNDNVDCKSAENLNIIDLAGSFGGNDQTKSENICHQVLVLADSDDEDVEKVLRNPNPHLEDEPIKTCVETLNLTLEEAFFLSYALGCLQVFDITGEHMKLKQLWQTFCEVKLDFIEMYIAYHYFRAKGWIVKTGYKFGGDFLLYKQGPPFYHASFIVLVERVNSKLLRQKESLTWTKLHGLNRVSEGSGKDVIICQILFPDDLTSEDLKTPKYLSRFQVNELLIKRWISSQERADKEVIHE